MASPKTDSQQYPLHYYVNNNKEAIFGFPSLAIEVLNSVDFLLYVFRNYFVIERLNTAREKPKFKKFNCLDKKAKIILSFLISQRSLWIGHGMQ